MGHQLWTIANALGLLHWAGSISQSLSLVCLDVAVAEADVSKEIEKEKRFPTEKRQAQANMHPYLQWRPSLQDVGTIVSSSSKRWILKSRNFKSSVKYQKFVIYSPKSKREPGNRSATLALAPTRTYKYFSLLENFWKLWRRTHPHPPPL